MGNESGNLNRLRSVGLLCSLVYLTKFVLGGDDVGGSAVLYTADEFAKQLPTKPHLVLFYAPWCGHCKRLMPAYELLAEKYNGELKRERVVIAKIDCTVETALCSNNDVTGYPTLLFYWSDPSVSAKFKGKRDLPGLEQFVEKLLLDGPPKEERETEEPLPPTKESLYDLTDDSFASHIATGHHFVKFFAPWCGHCRHLAPTWEELGKLFEDDDSVTIAKVDCTKFGNVCTKYSVRGYPTLIFFSHGKQVTTYQGARNIDALREFVEKSKSDQDNLEEMAADEFVPVQAAEEVQKPAADDSVASEEITAALELTDETFEGHISEGQHFVKFYAPWCGHCRNLAPIWDELAKTFKDDSSVSIAKVDCTKLTDVCKKYSIRGYPSLLFLNNGEKVTEYQGSRNLDDLKDFVRKTKAQQDGVKETDDTDRDDSKKVVDVKEESASALELTDATFGSHIATGHHFIKFFAPWCGHCKKLAPIWDELAKAFQDDSSVSIAKVDCTKFDSVCKQYSVRGFPTLLFFSKGDKVSQFSGSRSLDDLKEFVKKTKAEQDGVKQEQVADVNDESASTLELTDATFGSHIATGHHFIKFFAPWCGHCKKLAPIWDELAKAFQDDSSISISKIDCTKFGSVCSQYSVRGYPSLLFFSNGKQVTKYQGARTLDALKAFAEQTKAEQTDQDNKEIAEDISDDANEAEKAAVVTLNEKSFETQLEKGLTFVNYFQQGCKACESLEPIWLELGKKFKSEAKVVVANVDCSAEDELCRRNRVDGFPTLVLYSKGDRLAEYKGPHDVNALHAFVLQGMLNPQDLPSHVEL